MLENVPVSSIRINCMGGFQNSELQNFEQEYILSHIVRMSQSRGQWVSEFTLDEFLDEFDPSIALIETEEKFQYYFQQLMEKGYLEVESNTGVIRVTEKFAKLCEKYSY